MVSFGRNRTSTWLNSFVGELQMSGVSKQAACVWANQQPALGLHFWLHVNHHVCSLFSFYLCLLRYAIGQHFKCLFLKQVESRPPSTTCIVLQTCFEKLIIYVLQHAVYTFAANFAFIGRCLHGEAILIASNATRTTVYESSYPFRQFLALVHSNYR